MNAKIVETKPDGTTTVEMHGLKFVIKLVKTRGVHVIYHKGRSLDGGMNSVRDAIYHMEQVPQYYTPEYLKGTLFDIALRRAR